MRHCGRLRARKVRGIPTPRPDSAGRCSKSARTWERTSGPAASPRSSCSSSSLTPPCRRSPMPELANAERSKDAARTPAAAASRPAPGPVVGIGGLRMYLMRNGTWIKLPEDMTAEQAAQLEADGAAAEKKLGKGPPPQPVPDVKKPAKKEPVKEPHKRRRGRGAAARGKAAAKAAAAAAAALLGAVGNSKVAQYFASKALPVLTRGIAVLGKLKENEQTHDDAGEKLKKSEDAVVNPPSEGQSKSNAGQVDTVSERPAPVVEENKGKKTLQESLTEHLPKNIEAADNFQRDKKAQHMGTDVLQVVQGDKNAVVATFGAMTQTPPPAPPEQTPVELPPVETAPRTPPMNLAVNSLPPFLKEHIDMSGYTQQADQRLKEEGVTQEQLDMVDGGELAEANKEKKGMQAKAKSEPLAAQEFARQESTQLETDLAKEEKLGRDAMQVKRRAGLNNTAQKQKGTKSALEKKRDAVAAEINDRYRKAQESVTKKLEDLEKQSMKRFDDGNAAAAKLFEENVKRELDAYKADRYSGWFGWARKAKDWICGMDELPRVKQIFDQNRKIFVSTIDRLVEDIAAENKRVIQECKDELATARAKIQEYVDGLEPALKDIGKKAAGDMNDKLNDLDQMVGDKEKELQAKLKDKQTAAIKAIDQKIEKMKEAMSGALAKLGKLLLWAAKKFFTWALGKFGVSLGTIESIIDKGVAVLKAIFTGPIQFVKNLVRAAMLGFENFGKHFLTHLGNAVFAWLTGSLEGIKLPDSWGPKGILSVALQLAGISWQHIKKRMVRLIPQQAIDALEAGFPLVVTLIREGPMAAWEQLKDMAGEMITAFKDAVSNWIKRRIVEEAIKTVALAFIPGAGIIRAIIAIYDTIVFFIQKAKEILEMIGNFLGAIGDIAAGKIAPAADALEQGLALGLKLVIAFLAKLIKLDKVTQAIRDAIQKIQDKTEPIIDRVANWVVGMAKKAGKLVAGAAQKAAGAVMQWWKRKVNFKTDSGKQHSIFLEGQPPGIKVVVQSDRAYLEDVVAKLKGEDKKDAEALRKKIEKCIGDLDKLGARGKIGAEEDAKETKRLTKELDEHLEAISALLGKALPEEVVDLPRPKYKFDFSDDRAEGATVEDLSANRPMGSAPYQSPLGWDYLQKTGQTTDKDPYYRGLHLVSHRLGGPGQRQNLVPGCQANNSTMEKDFEAPIKDKVGHEPLQAKYRNVVTMTVKVEYKHSARTKLGKYTARDFPSKIECSYEYKESPRARKKQSGGSPVVLKVPEPN